ncbi:MAG: ribosome-associated translation inhibitor RaiA [Firmicutes bacterium]|nr:ribosome-associated translation inhibitor RaiA [Bacillota bacterium]
MQIIVRGKNIQLTDALRDYATKKVERLGKFFDQPLEAQVMLTVEKDRHTVEVTAMIDGLILRGEESSPDMYASIDLVTDKLERQIDRYKTRISRRLRTNEFKNGVAIPAESEDMDEGPRIVRSKRFAMKPMPVEEAVLQMNLLNHDFFVFINAETENFAVVYRRKDGNYGLIEPEN